MNGSKVTTKIYYIVPRDLQNWNKFKIDISNLKTNIIEW